MIAGFAAGKPLLQAVHTSLCTGGTSALSCCCHARGRRYFTRKSRPLPPWTETRTLAHNFDSVAVAIGIEKASDALALVSMGCDCGQGFLLGQPMPEERSGSLLRQRATSQARQTSSAPRIMEKRPA